MRNHSHLATVLAVLRARFHGKIGPGCLCLTGLARHVIVEPPTDATTSRRARGPAAFGADGGVHG